MATKVQRAEPAERPNPPRVETIRFVMPNLIQVDDTDDGQPQFSLAGVTQYDIDFQGHLDKLVESGVDRELAMRATDQMAEFVHVQGLATLIAKSMKRTG